MCVCVCVCVMHVCTGMCVDVGMSVSMYVCVWMFVYMYVCMFVCYCMCLCMYVHVCIHVYVCMCLCMHACMYVCKDTQAMYEGWKWKVDVLVFLPDTLHFGVVGIGCCDTKNGYLRPRFAHIPTGEGYPILLHVFPCVSMVSKYRIRITF